jgi:holo-[acyl-carrier protein] synthase
VDGPARRLIGLGYDLQFVADMNGAAALREPEVFFTAAEVARFQTASVPAESCAGAFAAKEALFKALPPLDGWFWTDAELVHDRHGAPAFRLHGRLADHLSRHRLRPEVSISHSGHFAGAVVALTREPLLTTLERKVRHAFQRVAPRAVRAPE